MSGLSAVTSATQGPSVHQTTAATPKPIEAVEPVKGPVKGKDDQPPPVQGAAGEEHGTTGRATPVGGAQKGAKYDIAA